MNRFSEPSLREFDRPIDRIILHKQASKRCVLLVEGPSDQRVLSNVIEDASWFPLASKSNVLEALDELVRRNVDGVLGIVDRDFDFQSKDCSSISRSRRLYYERRDLESMLVGMGTLSGIMANCGSAAKIDTLGGADRLVSKLIEAVMPIANLRSKNELNRWGLNFDKVAIDRFIDKRSLHFKVTSYCASLYRTSDESPSVGELEIIAQGPALDEYGPRGKDIIAAAGVALRSVAGSLEKSATSESLLTSILHAASGLNLSASQWVRELQTFIGEQSVRQ